MVGNQSHKTKLKKNKYMYVCVCVHVLCDDTRVQSLGSSSGPREDWDLVLQVQNEIRLLCFTHKSVV